MKPLHNPETFLNRFNYFKNGEFRSIEIINPTTITVSFAGQDEALEYDWKTIHFEFSGVQDAKLLDDSKCLFVNMEDGVSIIKSNNSISFGIGKCSEISAIKTSSFFIEAKSIKYTESSF